MVFGICTNFCFLMYLIWAILFYICKRWLFKWIGFWHISLVIQMVKNPREMYETWVQSLVGKISQRREYQPTPVFLPGEFHGQRSLEGYSPWVLNSQTYWVTNPLHCKKSYYIAYICFINLFLGSVSQEFWLFKIL